MRVKKIFTIFLCMAVVSLVYAARPQHRKAAAAAKPQTQAQIAPEEEEEDDISGETIVKTAMQFIGVPYRSGQSSPKGFDCSGFTSYIYKQFSIMLNRDSRSQYTQGKPIKNVADLRAGDLVFFGGRGARGIGHVGIVTEVSKSNGSFKFVHASNSSGIRVDDSKTAYYVKRYVGARRILNDGEEPVKD